MQGLSPFESLIQSDEKTKQKPTTNILSMFSSLQAPISTPKPKKQKPSQKKSQIILEYELENKSMKNKKQMMEDSMRSFHEIRYRDNISKANEKYEEIRRKEAKEREDQLIVSSRKNIKPFNAKYEKIKRMGVQDKSDKSTVFSNNSRSIPGDKSGEKGKKIDDERKKREERYQKPIKAEAMGSRQLQKEQQRKRDKQRQKEEDHHRDQQQELKERREAERREAERREAKRREVEKKHLQKERSRDKNAHWHSHKSQRAHQKSHKRTPSRENSESEDSQNDEQDWRKALWKAMGKNTDTVKQWKKNQMQPIEQADAHTIMRQELRSQKLGELQQYQNWKLEQRLKKKRHVH